MKMEELKIGMKVVDWIAPMEVGVVDEYDVRDDNWEGVVGTRVVFPSHSYIYHTDNVQHLSEFKGEQE